MRLIDADRMKANTPNWLLETDGMRKRMLYDELDFQPTVDEKEIIRKPMERILERVEKARQKYQRLVKEQGEKEDEAMNIHFRGVMKIVKEEGGIE